MPIFWTSLMVCSPDTVKTKWCNINHLFSSSFTNNTYSWVKASQFAWYGKPPFKHYIDMFPTNVFSPDLFSPSLYLFLPDRHISIWSICCYLIYSFPSDVLVSIWSTCLYLIHVSIWSFSTSFMFLPHLFLPHLCFYLICFHLICFYLICFHLILCFYLICFYLICFHLIYVSTSSMSPSNRYFHLVCVSISSICLRVFPEHYLLKKIPQSCMHI